jgi:hypothetical protein
VLGVNKISGKALLFGFQWKMIPWLSLDLDAGYAMPDQNRINYSAINSQYAYYKYENAYAIAYKDHVEFKNFMVFALGLNTHF